MGLLDDTAIFIAVIQQGGFSHAAKSLGLSNGLISRRIAQLEAQLGVTLIKRTTRQLQLTPEGELFWQHAQRIQQELDTALSLIQSQTEKPKGHIRVTAPLFVGRKILMPILIKFLNNFRDIKIDLVLTNQKLDPIKDNVDLLIRGFGYAANPVIEDSSLKMRLLYTTKIYLYASPDYLIKYGEPQTIEDLTKHRIIGYVDKVNLPEEMIWSYVCKGKKHTVSLMPTFNCNDNDSSIIACLSGFGIGKFPELIAKMSTQAEQLRPVLQQYDWGTSCMYAIYPQQQALPKRTRLLLDFIIAHTKNL